MSRPTREKWTSVTFPFLIWSKYQIIAPNCILEPEDYLAKCMSSQVKGTA